VFASVPVYILWLKLQKQYCWPVRFYHSDSEVHHWYLFSSGLRMFKPVFVGKLYEVDKR
jgi:hypothetical protein